LNFPISISYMKDNKSRTLDEFYTDADELRKTDINSLLPPDINKEIGHFNVFNLAETVEGWKQRSVMPYNRRTYYKWAISSSPKE